MVLFFPFPFPFPFLFLFLLVEVVLPSSPNTEPGLHFHSASSLQEPELAVDDPTPYDPGNVRNGWRTRRGGNFGTGVFSGSILMGGKTSWTRLLSSSTLTAGPLFSARNNLIYVGTREGQVFALQAGCTESVVWMTDLGTGTSITVSPVLDDNQLVLFVAAGSVGRTTSRSVKKPYLWGNPHMNANKISSVPRTRAPIISGLFALNATDGTLLWSTPWIPSPSSSSSSSSSTSTTTTEQQQEQQQQPVQPPPPIISDLRYIYPGLLLLTGEQSTSNPIYALNVSDTIEGAAAQAALSSATSTAISSSSSSSSAAAKHDKDDKEIQNSHDRVSNSDTPKDFTNSRMHIIDAPSPSPIPPPPPTPSRQPLPLPSQLWSCITVAPIHQPISIWQPWRIMQPVSTSPKGMIGWGSAFALADDGTVYQFDLDDTANTLSSCMSSSTSSSSSSSTRTPFLSAPSVSCEICSAWFLQKGNILLGDMTSGPVIHVITSKDVGGGGGGGGGFGTSTTREKVAAEEQPDEPLVEKNADGLNINITTAIVSARLFISTSASNGYSGGIYAFNLTAGGIVPPPPPSSSLPSLSKASFSTRQFPSYTPSLVRDSKRLIYSVTGASFPVAPTPLLIFPEVSSTSKNVKHQSKVIESSSSSSSSTSLLLFSEWLLVGTKLGEILCLDVTASNFTSSSRPSSAAAAVVEVVKAATSTSSYFRKKNQSNYNNNTITIIAQSNSRPSSSTLMNQQQLDDPPPAATLVWWQRIAPISHPSTVTTGAISDGMNAAIGFSDGTVYAFDVRNGQEIWKTATAGGASVAISPDSLIVDVEGRVYLTTMNGFVLMLDASCPVTSAEVIYISVAVSGTVIASVIIFYYCIQAAKIRNRVGVMGPTQEFVDSVLRAASQQYVPVSEWTNRVRRAILTTPAVITVDMQRRMRQHQRATAKTTRRGGGRGGIASYDNDNDDVGGGNGGGSGRSRNAAATTSFSTMLPSPEHRPTNYKNWDIFTRYRYAQLDELGRGGKGDGDGGGGRTDMSSIATVSTTNNTHNDTHYSQSSPSLPPLRFPRQQHKNRPSALLELPRATDALRRQTSQEQSLLGGASGNGTYSVDNTPRWEVDVANTAEVVEDWGSLKKNGKNATSTTSTDTATTGAVPAVSRALSSNNNGNHNNNSNNNDYQQQQQQQQQHRHHHHQNRLHLAPSLSELDHLTIDDILTPRGVALTDPSAAAIMSSVTKTDPQSSTSLSWSRSNSKTTTTTTTNDIDEKKKKKKTKAGENALSSKASTSTPSISEDSEVEGSNSTAETPTTGGGTGSGTTISNIFARFRSNTGGSTGTGTGGGGGGNNNSNSSSRRGSITNNLQSGTKSAPRSRATTEIKIAGVDDSSLLGLSTEDGEK